jgi:cyclic beta-1,2-glucan synthetase
MNPFRSLVGAVPDTEEPIRSELFGRERFEQHAESLARAQTVSDTPQRGRLLMPRVLENAHVLLDSYHAIARAIQDKQSITPAEEWLVDNFHIIDEQIREIRDDLPSGFYRQLPKLSSGPLEGYPRVYGVAWAFVAHTDSQFDPEALRNFIDAYQRVQPLTIGELWAVAISLRVILVENLRRLARQIVRSRLARSEADALADRLMIPEDDSEPASTAGLLELIGGTHLAPAFIVQLLQRLRDLRPHVRPVGEWLEQRLAAQSLSPAEIVMAEHQSQAAASATVRNIITSMRLVSAFDWSVFFERVSLVDAAMRARSDFGAMDFETRDAYRHAIEELARDARISELEVAQRALDRAARARSEAPDPERRGDPGYWLFAAGREPFEREVGARPGLAETALRLYKKTALVGYVGGIAVGTAIALVPLLVDAQRSGAGPLTLIVIGLLAAIPASGLVAALVNRAVTHILGPRPLPRYELKDGVPENLRTVVVVPTLLTTNGGVAEQIERIEVHYLSNADGDLRFALLSDWADAPTEAGLASDLDLLTAARGGIARLNRRYGPAPGGGERFLLFHRRRVWSESEQCWMGWERKRGKLHELNRHLRDATDTTFLADHAHPLPVLPNVRYVITLDSDTKLPRGSAKKLVGTMAHPLNRPRFDAREDRVVEGYAIAQPRITPSLPQDRGRTLFQWIYAGPAGIDPYAMAVSDVYQDLFDEGTFTGKGIYDVDAFETALAGKVPEASLLSHDLFEGTFARAALTTDVELVEDYPDHFESDAARQHRWARGDWQLLPWLLGHRWFAPDAPGAGPARQIRIPPLGRWKMFDNLRRSLTAPASFLTLLLGWLVPSLSPGLWTLFVLMCLGFPSLLPFLYGLDPRATSISWRSHFSAVLVDLWIGLCRIALDLTFLAYEAWLKADAMMRTLSRLFATHKKLLEWVTAAQASYSGKYDVAQAYRRMGGGVVLAAGAFLLLLLLRPGSLAVAGPILVLWAAAPAVAIGISRPPQAPKERRLSERERRYLRGVARRTWRYFEEFVTVEQNFLPPDNFQEDPHPVVAHRTSPTNLGMYLLAVLTARDFGWIATLEAVERLEATLDTMGRLERHRGHYFNWYDTLTLRPLDPRYVSTVDSGNLAGHMMTLANGCRDLMRSPGSGPLAFEGAQDVLALLREAARPAEDAPHKLSPRALALDQAMTTLAGSLTEPGALEESRFVALRADLVTVSQCATALADERQEAGDSELRVWARALEACLHSHARAESEGHSPRLAARLAAIVRTAETTVRAMDFTFLFDNTRKLFSIGYRPGEHSLDPSYYDLLASEARLTSFIAIAKGDVPSEHWFRLGRPLTPVGRGSALISWSGSMFEYLMPELILQSPAESLLRQTCERAVRRQISYGDERGVPWGISESAYNVRDRALTYQYSAFGVPGLRLQRGASDDIVIAPYATALAVMTMPNEAIRNLQRLALAGARGVYGYYEALDYTALRVPPGQDVAIVHAYFAHHQGMSLVAIGNALHGGVMRSRFHADPIVQATELLLQERTPSDVMVARPHVEDVIAAWEVRALIPPVERRFTTPHGPLPRTHLLSNGRYAVMVTAAGSGYSRWRDLAITRWREDPALDAYGSYIYLRDRATGRVWSAGHQPRGVEADEYEALFAEDHVSITRRDQDLITSLEIVVSSEEDAEVRRVSITNRGSKAREIEVTSYAELCLAPQRADVAHRAFSDLFVRTEFVPELGALLATRRMRAPAETPVWAACVLAIEGDLLGPLEFETDRARFLGRGRDLRRPLALDEGRTLSNTVGAVLDPMFSMRRTVRIAPGATARIVYSMLIAPDREAVLELATKYRDPRVFERAMAWAWTLAQVQMRHLGIQADEANVFQRLANALLYSDPAVRPSSDALSQNTLPLNALWTRGISGDRPIVLARIDEEHDIEIIRQLLRAHEYWSMKLIPADLVILVERLPSYEQNLQGALDEVVRTTQMRAGSDTAAHQSGVFVLRADLISAEERILLQTVARAVLIGGGGTLFEQIIRAPRPEATVPPRLRPERAKSLLAEALPLPELSFFNGLGGFADGGKEYVITLDHGRRTPRPWVNVIANQSFGFLASESGSGFTWSLNSHENRLTPWSNDGVSDPPGEAFYLRDEDSGETWTPTALPIRDPAASYAVHHGQGYTRFRHAAHGLEVELTQFVPKDDPVKISRLVIENPSDEPRRLSLTAYVEWVLGEARNLPGPHVITERDTRTGALLARSAFTGEFGGRIAFADLGAREISWTCDRTEFLGRNGSMARPRGQFKGTALSGRAGAGLDACAALRATFEVPAGGTIELSFLLGQGEGKEHARGLVEHYRSANLDAILAEVRAYWDQVLGTVEITTPDLAMDLMANRWLLYQTLACRVWARAGFYQAGGAYGFRDQLQDVMALCVAQPGLVREHLLRAASRQFPEGDVQHWWHPPFGRGVRTHISDDLLWLPYAVARYLEVTGDLSILDHELPFLSGSPLREDENECYFQPTISDQRAPLYEHCARAIDKSLAVGAHGLPLMGTGDWNDGMNRVGREGKGESVWLAWFLNAILRSFTSFAEARGQFERAVQWRGKKTALEAALDREAWDGEWYLRAFFDDGTPLGTARDVECRIDSIAQSWAVIAGGGSRERARQAMAAVDRHLVRREEQLVLLFTAPFDRESHDPGYIKGYPPGVRENGGQYTHAAVWAVVAAAMLGEGDHAHELFAMLNPITHAHSNDETVRYGGEPYVVAADVYSEPPHTGRAGWTWYTGAAGWLYRAAVEWILGFRLREDRCFFDPAIPTQWPGYRIRFRYKTSTYLAEVENPLRVARGIARIELDGMEIDATDGIPLVDDGADHRIRVVLGAPAQVTEARSRT